MRLCICTLKLVQITKFHCEKSRDFVRTDTKQFDNLNDVDLQILLNWGLGRGPQFHIQINFII